jgi:hypothetical protein
VRTTRSPRFDLVRVALAVALGAFASGAHASSLADAHEALRDADRPGTSVGERFATLDRIHANRIEPLLADVSHLTADELRTAFQAADTLAFYATFASDERLSHYIGRMGRLLEALSARDAALQVHVNAMFDALLSARKFDDATMLAKRFAPELAGRSVPSVAWSPGFRHDAAAVLALQEDGTLLAHNVDRAGDHLVVLVGCRASQRAIEDIDASPDLRAAFAATRTLWIVPADRMTDPDFLREWNARYPRQKAAFAYRNAAWSGVSFGSMPSFQRFKGERRRAVVNGWERGGGSEQLRTVLQAAD